MVRSSALAIALALAGTTLAAQNPSHGIAGLFSDPQPQANPPAQSGQGKHRFQYQFDPSDGKAGAKTILVLPAPMTPACPVSLRAQQRTSGSMLSTADGATSKIAQRIHLILGMAGLPARVAAATVTVRGTNGKWRVVEASQFQTQPQPSSPYTSTTLNVVFRKDADETEFADLDLPGFTSVKSIRLDSVTYADGTTWTAFGGQTCRVAPDPLMLVSSR